MEEPRTVNGYSRSQNRAGERLVPGGDRQWDFSLVVQYFSDYSLILAQKPLGIC